LPTSLSDREGRTGRCAIDHRGNKTGYLSPEGIAHAYEYLLNDRPKKIDFDGKVLDLNYDKTRLKQIVYPSGVTTAYDYNVGGWLRGIETKKDLATLLQRDYGFDHVGNIGTMTTQAGETVYGYDDIYQLTGADHPLATGLADENYSYDRVGNRLTSSATSGSWSHNQNNELTDTTDASYEYDANGNTVKKTVGTQVTRYEYNARNRLARVILPNGQVASYSYDPYGRRVRKQVDSLVTWYVYAEEGLVGEYSDSGSMQKIYGWMPGGLWGTDPLYMVEGGSYYFYHNDHLGTPQRLTSAASGAVVWGAGYAAFGLAQIDPLSTVENNLRFPGQYFDAETGLHYNFQRTYDPEAGRYTQVDPIGFAGGGNHFGYVQNNPSSLLDPFGLKPIIDIGGRLGHLVGQVSIYLGQKSRAR
jgi:RHS repeat-associated protein